MGRQAQVSQAAGAVVPGVGDRLAPVLPRGPLHAAPQPAGLSLCRSAPLGDGSGGGASRRARVRRHLAASDARTQYVGLLPPAVQQPLAGVGALVCRPSGRWPQDHARRRLPRNGQSGDRRVIGPAATGRRPAAVQEHRVAGALCAGAAARRTAYRAGARAPEDRLQDLLAGGRRGDRALQGQCGSAPCRRRGTAGSRGSARGALAAQPRCLGAVSAVRRHRHPLWSQPPGGGAGVARRGAGAGQARAGCRHVRQRPGAASGHAGLGRAGVDRPVAVAGRWAERGAVALCTGATERAWPLPAGHVGVDPHGSRRPEQRRAADRYRPVRRARAPRRQFPGVQLTAVAWRARAGGAPYRRPAAAGWAEPAGAAMARGRRHVDAAPAAADPGDRRDR